MAGRPGVLGTRREARAGQLALESVLGREERVSGRPKPSGTPKRCASRRRHRAKFAGRAQQRGAMSLFATIVERARGVLAAAKNFSKSWIDPVVSVYCHDITPKQFGRPGLERAVNRPPPTVT